MIEFVFRMQRYDFLLNWQNQKISLLEELLRKNPPSQKKIVFLHTNIIY